MSRLLGVSPDGRFCPDSENLCGEVLDAVGDHVAVIDSAGLIVRVNAAWSRFSDENGGIRSRTGVGSNYLEVCEQSYRSGVVEAGDLVREVRTALAGRAGREILYPCHSPTELRWFSVKPVRISAGDKVHVAIFHSNVTAKSLLQSRLVGLTQDLQDARRRSLLNEWTSLMAHEVKNPLTTIALQGQVLKRTFSSLEPANQRIAKSCDVILKATHAAVDLIDSTRALPRGQEEPMESMNAKGLFEDLITILKGWLEITRKTIELRSIDPALSLYGHRVQLSLAIISVLFYLDHNQLESISVSAIARGEWVDLQFRTRRKGHDGAEDFEYRLAEKLSLFEGGKIRRTQDQDVEEVNLSVPRQTQQRIAA